MAYLLRFIEEDPEGIDAYRTQKLGFIEVAEGTQGYDFPVKLQYMVISAVSIGEA